MRRGEPGRILEAIWAGDLDLVSSEPLLDELRQVLAYPKIRKRLDAHRIDVDLFLDLLPFFVTTVDVENTDVPLPRDADDRVALATLVAAQANWLISGDEDLLVLADQFPIIAPAAFVEQYL